MKTITKSIRKSKTFPRVFKYEKKNETIITIYYRKRIETFIAKKNLWTPKDFKKEYGERKDYTWDDYLFNSIENETANGAKEVAGNIVVFKEG